MLTTTTRRFCAAYGFALEDSANTIVVIGKSDPPVYAACVVLATHRLDVNRVVKQRLGTRKASFASCAISVLYADARRRASSVAAA